MCGRKGSEDRGQSASSGSFPFDYAQGQDDDGDLQRKVKPQLLRC
jgi:hypothetical protein